MSLKMDNNDIRELAEAFCAAPSEDNPLKDIAIPRRFAPGIAHSKPQQVGSRFAKSGLTKIMRAWMSARTGNKAERRFSVQEICAELAVPPGKEHQQMVNALYDFTKRGEIISYYNHKHKRRQYLYVQGWRPGKKGKKNQKIFKAMYVSQSFAVTDIQRLAGVKERDWIDRIVRQLKEDEYLQQIGKRLCAHGAGSEAIYHIVNRDKFKLENMK